MSGEGESWLAVGQAEIRRRAQQLLERILDRRPEETDWTQLRKYVSLLAELRDYETLTLPATVPSTPEVPEVRPVQVDQVTAGVSDVRQTDEQTEGLETQVGTFHQGLRGGKLVTEAGREIPVVEKIAESAGLHHGDTVKAIFEDWFPDGRPKFFFVKLRAVAGGVNPDRVEAVGYVERCSSGFGLVRANGLEVEAPGFELREVGASEGDVVTVAYMQPEVQDGRVRGAILRVHGSDRSQLAAAVQPPRIRRVENAPGLEQERYTQFSGRPRVMIVGGRNWPFYRDGVSRLGGDPAYVDAFTNDGNLHNAVAGVDIVVVIKSYCSHSRYDKVKAVAKQKGRLFFSTSKENWSGLRALFERDIIPAWNAQVPVAAD